MKKTWQCPKCQSQRVGYLETLPDQRDGQDHDRKIGSAITSSLGPFGVGTMVGVIEAFVCTECGYFEEYVKEPTSIPWDQVSGFRWCVRP